jgi:ribosomal protein L23
MLHNNNTVPSLEPVSSLTNKSKLISVIFKGIMPDHLDELRRLQKKIEGESDQKKVAEKLARIKVIEANDDKLKSLLIVVSLFQPYYMNEYLHALIALLKTYYTNSNNSYKKVNIYLAGLLQRHNFWNFTTEGGLKADKNLKELIKDIIIDKTKGDIAKQLADQLAEKFWSLAIDVENIAYHECQSLLRTNIQNCNYKIYRWNDLTPVSNDEKNDNQIKQDLMTYRKALDSEYENKEKPNFSMKVNKFISRIIGNDPSIPIADVGNKDLSDKNTQRQIIIYEQASRILRLLKLSEEDCSAYQLAKACALNFVLEESSGFPILHRGNWSSIGYPYSKEEEDYFRTVEQLMMAYHYINEGCHLRWTAFQFTENLITNYDTLIHKKQSKSSSCSLLPRPSPPFDPNDLFSLDNNSETKDKPSSFDDTKAESENKQTSPAQEKIPVDSPDSNMLDAKLETNSSPMSIESKVESSRKQPPEALESKQVENYSWLKYPETVINYIKSLLRTDLSYDFSLQPGVKKLDIITDDIYKQNFISIICVLPKNIIFLSLQYIARHFSQESVLEILRLLVRSKDINNLDLSSNNLFQYRVGDLIEILSRITESLVLTNNQLHELGEENLILLIRALINAKMIDLSDNNLHNFHYKTLAKIFAEIPKNIEVLKLDAYCFKKLSHKELFEIFIALPKTVSLVIDGGNKSFKETVKKIMEIREAELEIILKVAQHMRNAAVKAYDMHKQEPIFTFFLHSDADKKQVQAAIANLFASKTLSGAIAIIDGLLSRKGATLHNNSFDTIYIKSFYDSSEADLDFYTIRSSYGVPKFAIKFPKYPREETSRVAYNDRIKLKEAFWELLSKFESYKQNAFDLEPEGYTNSVIRKYSL